jgi:hypothetical protein
MKAFICAFAVVGIWSAGTPASCAQQEEAAGATYVIVTDAKADVQRDPYEQVVQELVKLRKPKVVLRLGSSGLTQVLGKLRDLKPDYVAFVVHPERIEDNFVGSVFEGLTAFDRDPDLDCAYGYITGATAEDALNLVRNTAAAEAHPEKIPKRFVAIAHTFAGNDLGPFADQQGAIYRARGYEAAGINPRDNSDAWKEKADQEIQKLNGASLVFLAGHGMGDMSCAIRGPKFGGVKLESAIVVNGTCHSAVTCVRHDSTDMHWTIKKARIDLADSVCLNFIKAGAIGQFGSTASSSWQNVCYTIGKFFDQGATLGEALQQSLNDKIRAAGIKTVDISPFESGAASPQSLGDDKNPGGIQSFSRVVLIGDPAYRPFPTAPVSVAVTPAAPPKDYSDLPPEEQHIRELIDRMSDPNAPRFQALNDVIRIGSPAVPILIEAMKASDEWQIPKALGAIRDKRAIGPLIDKLAACNWSPMRDVVAEALGLLTGESYGTDAAAWRAWWEEQEPGDE